MGSSFVSKGLYILTSAGMPQTRRCSRLGFLPVQSSKGIFGTDLLGICLVYKEMFSKRHPTKILVNFTYSSCFSSYLKSAISSFGYAVLFISTRHGVLWNNSTILQVFYKRPHMLPSRIIYTIILSTTARTHHIYHIS